MFCVFSRRAAACWKFKVQLGGTTCLTLLVQYGLIRFLRHHLSNTAKRVCCMIRHFRIKHVLDK